MKHHLDLFELAPTIQELTYPQVYSMILGIIMSKTDLLLKQNPLLSCRLQHINSNINYILTAM